MGEGSVMRMAGLFDVWSSGADAAPLYTYTILTTDSSKRLQWYCFSGICNLAANHIATQKEAKLYFLILSEAMAELFDKV